MCGFGVPCASAQSPAGLRLWTDRPGGPAGRHGKALPPKRAEPEHGPRAPCVPQGSGCVRTAVLGGVLPAGLSITLPPERRTRTPALPRASLAHAGGGAEALGAQLGGV